jgi:hypothetical protein
MASLHLVCASLLAGGSAAAQAPQPYGYDPQAPPPQGYVVPAPYYDPLIERERQKELKRIVRSWEPGEPIPPGYHPVTGPHLGLTIAGGVTFGVAWLFSAVGGFAIGVNRPEYLPMIIPIAGPFVTAYTSGAGSLTIL